MNGFKTCFQFLKAVVRMNLSQNFCFKTEINDSHKRPFYW